MTTETVAPDKPKRTMSEEHKRKMAEGRARRNAAIKAAAAPPASPVEVVAVLEPMEPVSAVPDPRDAEIAALKARLAALEPSPDLVAALPKQECLFQFRTTKVNEQGERVAVGREIRALDDPQWAELAQNTQPIFGSLIVYELTRNKRGEIVERREIHAQQIPQWHLAREMMERVLLTGRPYEHVKVGA